jgi:ArsR family transcriptional regulator
MGPSAGQDRVRRPTSAVSSALEPLTRPAAEALAKTLRLVADPTRLQLLSMINGSPGQEVTVGELTQHLGLRQPTISHHLRLMYEDGLLDRDQRGRQVWYSIAEDRRDAVADLLR